MVGVIPAGIHLLVFLSPAVHIGKASLKGLLFCGFCKAISPNLWMKKYGNNPPAQTLLLCQYVTALMINWLTLKSVVAVFLA